MYYKLLPVLLLAAAFSFSARAQGTAEGIQSFGQAENAWKRNDTEQTPKPVVQFVDTAGNLAMKNIFEAEQVFCYEVFPQDPEYQGYTLNNFPIRGFCGVLNQDVRNMINQHFFATDEGVDFENAEQCMIQPKIMLRFVRGVDYTDVLFSSPCHALVIFYGGSLNAYNYKPAAELIDTIVNNLQSKHQEFVSPALLNQVLPIGVVQNEQQRKMINKNSEPIRKWEAKAEARVKKQEEEIKRQNTGWNKLKTRLK